ncbi:MAG: hypothetical protein HY791_04955 [Deltaproteobacteria bacterium]|nr:hypothetical protein [Deltaproteobacteria bacterium]
MRADAIVVGAAITLATLERYGAMEMRVTHRGVRYGLLEELRVGLG